MKRTEKRKNWKMLADLRTAMTANSKEALKEAEKPKEVKG